MTLDSFNEYFNWGESDNLAKNVSSISPVSTPAALALFIIFPKLELTLSNSNVVLIMPVSLWLIFPFCILLNISVGFWKPLPWNALLVLSKKLETFLNICCGLPVILFLFSAKPSKALPIASSIISASDRAAPSAKASSVVYSYNDSS